MTNDSILKLAGAFHGLKTSRIRFCAFYSMAAPCGRSFQVIMYFMIFPSLALCDHLPRRLWRWREQAISQAIV